MASDHPPVGVGAPLAVWALALAGGLATLTEYEARPGETGVTPVEWPLASALSQRADRPALLMFVHPHCPCTRASLLELEAAAARFTRPVDVRVMFYRPAGEAPGWEKSGLWFAAERIPGVTPEVDLDGREAARFGAETSGQVVLYGPDRRVRFRGGITEARGHAGEKAGRAALIALINGDETVAPSGRRAVFGCSLRTPDAAPSPAARKAQP